MGRIIARLLLLALKSTSVQTATQEVSAYMSRRATAFILRKLRAGAKRYND